MPACHARVTRLTDTWHKGLEIPGLFINTVGFVSFLNWICVFASLPGWICSNGTVLTNSHVSSGHYQRCNHETAPMGKAVESLSTDFHTFLQMICHVSSNFHVSYGGFWLNRLQKLPAIGNTNFSTQDSFFSTFVIQISRSRGKETTNHCGVFVAIALLEIFSLRAT